MPSLPPPPDQREEDRIHVGAAFLVLLGFAAWVGAAGVIAVISEQEADSQMAYLAASVALSVVGATFLIIAVLLSNRR